MDKFCTACDRCKRSKEKDRAKYINADLYISTKTECNCGCPKCLHSRYISNVYYCRKCNSCFPEEYHHIEGHGCYPKGYYLCSICDEVVFKMLHIQCEKCARCHEPRIDHCNTCRKCHTANYIFCKKIRP